MIAAQLVGETIVALERRGKYLVVRLDGGDALVIHLRMTGNLLHLADAALPEPPFTRARLVLEGGAPHRLHRRAPLRHLAARAGAGRGWLDARLGPEPLDGAWTPALLARALRGRRIAVKAALLDQKVVAGVGNIYADEALWRARLHPRLPAERVRGARAAALHGAVREVLEEGIEAQGASIRDFRTPDGGYGSAQERFAVYGRAGEPCERCGTPLERIVVGQRGTVFCRRCQRPPRGA